MLTVPGDAAENLASMLMRNATVSCSILGNEDKIFLKRFWRRAGGSPSHSQCIPQLGSLQHRRAPVHDSASGLAKTTDVLNFLKQMQCNLPSVQKAGLSKICNGMRMGPD